MRTLALDDLTEQDLHARRVAFGASRPEFVDLFAEQGIDLHRDYFAATVTREALEAARSYALSATEFTATEIHWASAMIWFQLRARDPVAWASLIYNGPTATVMAAANKALYRPYVPNKVAGARLGPSRPDRPARSRGPVARCRERRARRRSTSRSPGGGDAEPGEPAPPPQEGRRN